VLGGGDDANKVTKHCIRSFPHLVGSDATVTFYSVLGATQQGFIHNPKKSINENVVI
jgi:hypothetical protein